MAKDDCQRTAEGKLNGRASPILLALKRVIGGREYLDYFRAFRNPQRRHASPH